MNEVKILPLETPSTRYKLTKHERALLERLMKENTNRQDSQVIENNISAMPAKVVCEKRAAVLFDFIIWTWIRSRLLLEAYMICERLGSKGNSRRLFKKLQEVEKQCNMGRSIFMKLWPNTFTRLLD
jgi:hypothetical protein